MKEKSPIQNLQDLVTLCDAAILYQPTPKEIDYTSKSFPFKMPPATCYLPKDKHSDPLEWADICLKDFQDRKVFILIPGTKFDIYGTRHGAGGGWYDRFLAKLPAHWLRIGITKKAGWSQKKLVRQEWDQPMDWLLVQNNLWEVYKFIPDNL